MDPVNHYLQIPVSPKSSRIAAYHKSWSVAMGNLGTISRQQGKLHRAAELFREGFELGETACRLSPLEQRLKTNSAWQLRNLCLLYAQLGQVESILQVTEDYVRPAGDDFQRYVESAKIIATCVALLDSSVGNPPSTAKTESNDTISPVIQPVTGTQLLDQALDHLSIAVEGGYPDVLTLLKPDEIRILSTQPQFEDLFGLHDE